MDNDHPTPDRELNDILAQLVSGARSVLGDNFLAAYLQGSFALNDWDEDSDVDFVVVIQRPLNADELAGLNALHGRLYDLPSHWAQHLEGSYFPKDELRRYDPDRPPQWFLDNTARLLERSPHDNTLVVRWLLREYGIPLTGPPAAEWIDPLEPDALRAQVRGVIQDWAKEIFDNPAAMNNRWYQPYAVINFSRMLYTVRHARVISKRAGVQWARETLDPRWQGLLQRAWEQRPDPSSKILQPADPADLKETLEFLHYLLSLI